MWYNDIMVTVKKAIYPDMDPDSPYFGEYTYYLVRDDVYIALTYSEKIANQMAKALNGDLIEDTNTFSSRMDDFVNSFGCPSTFLKNGSEIVAVILKDTDAEIIMTAYNKNNDSTRR